MLASAGALGLAPGLLIAALMLSALSFALGLRYGLKALRCPAHGRACSRCTECP